MSATYLCEMLARPKIQAFIARETRRTIANGQMRAGSRLIELLDAKSELACLDATKTVLAINGIRPPDTQVSVSIDVRAGFVIDLTDRTLMPRQGDIEAKPLETLKTVSDISGS